MFKDHPPGLKVVFFAEFWERFSYYGMWALLTLYMTKDLLYSDERAIGVFAAYASLVYVTPVIGGMLADRILGERNAIILGSGLMALGHFLMAFQYEMVFYTALAVIVAGNGFFKPNMSGLLGKLYEEKDELRDNAFYWFYLAVNLGSMLAPILCGIVAGYYGRHWGFTLAGFGMLSGLIVFVKNESVFDPYGRPPNEEDARTPQLLGLNKINWVWIGGLLSSAIFAVLILKHQAMSLIMGGVGIAVIAFVVYHASRENRQKQQQMFVAMVLIFFSVLFWSFFHQAGSSLTLFADRNLKKHFGSGVTVSDQSLEKLQEIEMPTELRDALLAMGGKDFDNEEVFLAELSNQSGISDLSSHMIPILRNVDRGQFRVNAMILNSMSGLWIVILVPVFTLIWPMLARRNLEPRTPAKFAFALLFIGIGFGVFASGVNFADNEALVPFLFFVVGWFFITIGELSLSPVGLTMISRLSPAHIVGFMMATWLLSNAFANHIAGIIARLTAASTNRLSDGMDVFQTLGTYTDVFMQICWIGIGAAVLLFLISKPLNKWMHDVK